MSLPPLSLDDLTYEDLRLLAVQRIAAASGTRWTHHEPVDPGVTLLELLAFLLDQQVFMLDQLSDAMLHALFGLLGETPAPTRCARTVVAPLLGKQSDAFLLEQGAPIVPVAAELGDVVFTAPQESVVLPVSAMTLHHSGGEAPLPLLQPMQLLSGAGAAARFGLEIVLSQPVPAALEGKEIGLALLLSDNEVAPEWSHEAADVPPPAQWDARLTIAGATIPLADWHDGTGGLRRSGLVRFAIPAQLVGSDRFRIGFETQQAHHPVPVLLESAWIGAAIVEHRWQRVIGPVPGADAESDAILAALQQQVDAMLPISGNVMQVPASLGAVLEDQITAEFRHKRDGWLDWQAAPSLHAAGAQDRLFTVDRALGQLAFGDGLQGRIPAPADQVRLTANVGGGDGGNHPAGLEWQEMDGSAALAVQSIVPANEGAEAETLEQARQRIAASLLERERAVTESDFVELAENLPGIAGHRAFVAVGHDPDFPCIRIDDAITVFVVPRTPADITDPKADDGALAAIRADLEVRRLLTMRVIVTRPAIRPIGLGIHLTGAGAEQVAGLRADLEQVLRTYLHPTLGGPAGTGWPQGQSLGPSELLRVAQGELEQGVRVESVSIALLDEEGSSSDCAEVAIGEFDLVRLASLSLQVSAGMRAEAVL